MKTGGKNLFLTKGENSCENAADSEGLPAPSKQGGIFGKGLSLMHKIKDKPSVSVPEGPLIPEPFRTRERSSILGKKFLEVKSVETFVDDFMECSDSSLSREIKGLTSLQKNDSVKICTGNSLILEKSAPGVKIQSMKPLPQSESPQPAAKSIPFALTESGQIPELSSIPDPFEYNHDLEAERELLGSGTDNGQKEKAASTVRKKAPAKKRPVIEDDSDEERQPAKKSKASDKTPPVDTDPEVSELGRFLAKAKSEKTRLTIIKTFLSSMINGHAI